MKHALRERKEGVRFRDSRERKERAFCFRLTERSELTCSYAHPAALYVVLGWNTDTVRAEVLIVTDRRQEAAMIP
jgi:hypothetical protein